MNPEARTLRMLQLRTVAPMTPTITHHRRPPNTVAAWPLKIGVPVRKSQVYHLQSLQHHSQVPTCRHPLLSPKNAYLPTSFPGYLLSLLVLSPSTHSLAPPTPLLSSPLPAFFDIIFQDILLQAERNRAVTQARVFDFKTRLFQYVYIHYVE
jgi:hypothetical protein